MISTEDEAIRDAGPWMQEGPIGMFLMRNERAVCSKQMHQWKASLCGRFFKAPLAQFSMTALMWVFQIILRLSDGGWVAAVCILSSKGDKFSLGGISKCSHEYFKFLNVIRDPFEVSFMLPPSQDNCVCVRVEGKQHMVLWSTEFCAGPYGTRKEVRATKGSFFCTQDNTTTQFISCIWICWCFYCALLPEQTRRMLSMSYYYLHAQGWLISEANWDGCLRQRPLL